MEQNDLEQLNIQLNNHQKYNFAGKTTGMGEFYCVIGIILVIVGILAIIGSIIGSIINIINGNLDRITGVICCIFPICIFSVFIGIFLIKTAKKITKTGNNFLNALLSNQYGLYKTYPIRVEPQHLKAEAEYLAQKNTSATNVDVYYMLNGKECWIGGYLQQYETGAIGINKPIYIFLFNEENQTKHIAFLEPDFMKKLNS